MDMSNAPNQHLLEALLDSWDRNNTILLNLLRALPEGGLEARAMEGSPSIAQLFTHIHSVRLVFVFERCPDRLRKPALAGPATHHKWPRFPAGHPAPQSGSHSQRNVLTSLFEIILAHFFRRYFGIEFRICGGGQKWARELGAEPIWHIPDSTT